MRRKFATALSTVLTVGASLTAAPPARATIVPEPFHHPSFTNVSAVTSSVHRIYVAAEAGLSDASPDAVVSFTFEGELDETIGPIPGPHGVAIKGSTLYVSAHDTDEIWLYDVSTDPATFLGATSVSPNVGPRRLVIAENRVWFDTNCDGGWNARIVSIALDGTDPVTEITASDPETTSDWTYCADLDGGPETSHLFLSSEGLSPSHLDIYDVSADPNTYLSDDDARQWEHGDYYRPSDILPFEDGETFAMGGIGGGIDIRNISDMTKVETYTGVSTFPDALASTSSNGGLLAASIGYGTEWGRTVIWTLGDPDLVTEFQLPPIVESGLAFNVDGTKLVALSSGSDGLEIYVLDPLAVGSSLTAVATPVDATIGEPISVDGALSFQDGRDASGQTLAVLRKQGGSEVSLGDVITGLDGRYHIEDTPPSDGRFRYVVSFPGEDHLDAASAGITVQVEKIETRVDIRVSDHVVDFGQAVRVTGHLGAGTEDDILGIFARTTDGRRRLLEAGPVDDKGNLRVTLEPAETLTFIARYDGDDTHTAGERTSTTKVRVRLSATLRNFTSRSGFYKIYPAGGTATVVVSVIPNHRGDFVRFTMQAYRNGSWRTVDTASFRLKADSTVVVYARGHAGVNFRIQARLRSHRDHLGDTSPWLRFRFSG